MGDQGPKWKFASVFINLASFSPPKSSTTSIQVKIDLHGAYCDIDDTYTVLGCILVYCKCITFSDLFFLAPLAVVSIRQIKYIAKCAFI